MKTIKGALKLLVVALGIGEMTGCRAPGTRKSTAVLAPRLPVTVEGLVFESRRFSEWGSEQRRVGFRNVEKIRPTRLVARGRRVTPLARSHVDLSGFTYTFEGQTRTLEDFMRQTNVAGLLALRDDRIVIERYARGHSETSTWTSFSVAKSVVSMLFGAALLDGSISSLDDSVTKYIPQLQGSAYDGVTLKQLLQMSSGVAWNEDYEDPAADLYRMPGRLGSDSVLAYLKRRPRASKPGARYNYNSGEIDLAGLILRSATRRTVSDYLSEKIWRPAGMEANAHWVTFREDDAEYADCCLSATLRDFGRLGLVALHDGVSAGGTRLLARGWMSAATTSAPTNPEYGFLWWLAPLPDQSFMAVGIYGQNIYVDPVRKLVIVIQSFWDKANPPEMRSHRAAFRQALATAVSGSRSGVQ